MLIFKRISDIAQFVRNQKLQSVVSGFVPTMGALHEGHLSLVRKAKEACNLAICSIFVNPTQFNDPEDYKKYPVTLEQDIHQLEKSGCDVLFLPSASEIYPEGSVPIHYDIGYLETILEGAYRPGHFQGVCQVVHKLLDIVQPDQLFMGQKDYQQCMVIKRLLSLIGSTTQLIVIETSREPDGLAMSSRNMRLSPEQRKLSTAIYQTLSFISQHIQSGSLQPLLSQAEKMLTAQGLKPDYITIAQADTLEIIDFWDGQTAVVALTAAFMGNVRLIDNMAIPLNFA